MNKAELQSAIDSGMTTREIAKQFDISQTKVVYWLRKFDLQAQSKIRGGRKAAEKVQRHCLNCNKVVRVKYCSSTCLNAHRKALLIQSWLAGELSGSQKDGEILPALRNWMIEQANSACTECGWSRPNPILHRPILTVDHIDGNWQNNVFDNLKVLCYNCHTLTPTFGALNKGNPLKPAAGVRKIGT